MSAATPEPATAVVTADLIVREATDAFVRLTGRPREHLVGRHVLLAFSADDPDSAASASGGGAGALLEQQYRDALTEIAHLRSALESRATIDQAKGVVMAVRDCGVDEAFRHLMRLSQDRNVKLREIAAAVVARRTCDEPLEPTG